MKTNRGERWCVRSATPYPTSSTICYPSDPVIPCCIGMRYSYTGHHTDRFDRHGMAIDVSKEQM
jgi:hypothetical protein